MTTSPATQSEAETTAATVDVVLPCLNEAEALPWVLARIPPTWRALVVDNGSTDGSPELARALGATVVRETRRGFGAACHAGLTAATADIVCFCDCDASLDPSLLVPFVREVRDGRGRPGARAAPPAGPGRLARARPGGQPRARTDAAPPHGAAPARPRPAARRPPGSSCSPSALTDRRSGYPLQMVVRAADAGWRVVEHDVPYLPRTGASKVTGTWRGTWQAVRDMSRVLAEPPVPPDGAASRLIRRTPRRNRSVTTLLVIAKEPRPGRVKTRLTPPFTPRGGGGARRGGARGHPAHGGGHTRPTPRAGARRSARTLAAARLRRRTAVRGRPGRAAGRRLRRLRRARPAHRHGHPAGDPRTAHRGLRRLRRVLRPGRGRRLLGAGPRRARTPNCCGACRCRRPRRAPCSAPGSPPRACAYATCRACGTWTRPTTRRRSPRLAPDGRFAAELGRLGAVAGR